MSKGRGHKKCGTVLALKHFSSEIDVSLDTWHWEWATSGGDEAWWIRVRALIFVVELEGRAYRCKFCKTHLALADDLVSKAFHCRGGKAYLFNNAVNITVGSCMERLMLSGMHTVADIFCCCCGQIVGWKYEAAHEKSQKYKEGKFVLERGRIIDAVDSEFYIDTRPSLSDAEDP